MEIRWRWRRPDPRFTIGSRTHTKNDFLSNSSDIVHWPIDLTTTNTITCGVGSYVCALVVLLVSVKIDENKIVDSILFLRFFAYHGSVFNFQAIWSVDLLKKKTKNTEKQIVSSVAYLMIDNLSFILFGSESFCIWHILKTSRFIFRRQSVHNRNVTIRAFASFFEALDKISKMSLLLNISNNLTNCLRRIYFKH